MTVSISLILAVKMKNEEAIKTLILNRADIHIKGVDKWTALFAACSVSDAKTISLLIRNGANLNELD